VPGLLFVALCLVVAAVLGEGGTWHERLVHDAIQTAGTAALAVCGLGTWIEIYRQRRWRKLTQSIAIDLLDQCIRQVGAITAQAVYLMRGDEHLRRNVDQVFRLPWSSARAEEMIASTTGLRQELIDQLPHDRVPVAHDTEGVDQIVREVSSEMASRAEKLRTAALELDAYVEAQYVVNLVNAVIVLHRSVRELTDELPRLTGQRNLDTVVFPLLAPRLVEHSVKVALCLGEPYVELRKDLEGPLLTELGLSEGLGEEGLERLRDRRERRRWLDDWRGGTAEIVRSMGEDFEILDRGLQDFLDDVEQES
jgi:hypothetical protein